MRTRSGIGIMVGTGAAAVAGAMVLSPIAASAGQVAATATAQSLDVDKKASISARGAAIRIPYRYLCANGWEGNLSVQVVEALGNDLASGYGNKTLKCNGAKKTTSIYLQVGAYQGARPFKPGPASIVATLDSYDPKADPCSNGGPCPIEGVAKAVPPPGATFSAASLPATPTMTPARAPGMSSADTTAHSEFQGTITLVD